MLAHSVGWLDSVVGYGRWAVFRCGFTRGDNDNENCCTVSGGDRRRVIGIFRGNLLRFSSLFYPWCSFPHIDADGDIAHLRKWQVQYRRLRISVRLLKFAAVPVTAFRAVRAGVGMPGSESIEFRSGGIPLSFVENSLPAGSVSRGVAKPGKLHGV